MEWEAQDGGVIAKILMPEGSSGIEVGTPVLVIADSADAVPAFAAFTAADASGAPPPAAAAAAAPAAAPAAAKAAAPAAAPRAAAPTKLAPGDRIVASPYAKKLAADAGISLAGAPGSGPGGRLVAADVQQLIASGGAAPAGGAPAAAEAAPPAGAYAYAGYTDVPNTQIRKVTARRLLESKQQIPHYYLTISARVDALQQFRCGGGTGRRPAALLCVVHCSTARGRSGTAARESSNHMWAVPPVSRPQSATIACPPACLPASPSACLPARAGSS
jgi:pyruvate dehydrogenase E2 component (dihydrolipoamide acetyltransferase)